MSLESFFGLEDADSQGSTESSEKYREQARKNAKAIKAMTGHQQQQKKKEDKLAKILVKFIQDTSKSDLVFLVVKLLQENVPGAFILAVLTIANAELEAELKESFKEIAMPQDQLIDFSVDSKLPEVVKLPPNIRTDLNSWGESILKAGLMMPGRTLETVLTPEHKLKSIVLDLIDYALEEYFQRHGLEFTDQHTRQFALLSIQSVLIKLRDKANQMTDAEIIETPLEGTL
ncbi:hypothetical protein HOD30_00530 [Candidatus Peregrinibacteria bacterium]|jgi:hypothetical protein|nr:hypothetical protein [Candidatus Peregrinibacteria bacterium]MBT4631972.1 hypothetical protein [Candidatus Peregrinibacteria bacterium]MBT5517082.1 hypothetical protein [Candidatus Peregrinibacteria bacterium]MBT5823639.1 hypothetical protein [Candidatus Peregrinibacteria bacterium]